MLLDHPVIKVNHQPFVGRTEEQEQFRATLMELLYTPPSENLPCIVLLHGDTGMGKSTLVKRMIDITKSEFLTQFQTLSLDWEHETKRNTQLQVGRDRIEPELIFYTLHQIACDKGWGKFFGKYQAAIKVRREAEQRADAVLSAANDKDNYAVLRDVTSTAIAKIFRVVAPAVAPVPILALAGGETGEKLVKAFSEIGIKVGADQAAKLRAEIERRLRGRLNQDQYKLLLDPHEQLALALAEGFQQIAKACPLIIFMDTYEIVDRADFWLRTVIQAAGPQLLWVIAGRNDLLRSRGFGVEYFNGYQNDFPRRLLACGMSRLSSDEIQAYFVERSPNRILDPTELKAIDKATCGIPLAVRAAADIWATGQSLAAIVNGIGTHTPSNTIVREMIDRYQLHCITNESDKHALHALALARGDNGVLRAMLRPVEGSGFNLEPYLSRLERDYTSVHRENARLHSEPEIFFRENLRSDLLCNEPWVQTLIQRAIDALQERIANREKELPLIEDRCADRIWIGAVFSLADYLFRVDEEKAWHWIIPRFVEGFAYSPELVNNLLKVAEEWQDKLSSTGKRRVELLRIENRFTENADLLDELSRLERRGWLSGEGETERHAILNLHHGRLCYQREQYVAAQHHYEQAERGVPEEGEQLKKQLSEQWMLLSGALKSNRKLDGELEAFRRAINLERKEADTYMELGNLYRDMKRYMKALDAFKTAAEIDPKDDSPYRGQAAVYYDMGKYDEALVAFQRVAEFTPEDASVYSGQGMVYRALGEYENALVGFQRAASLDPGRAELYANQGNLHHALGHTEEALVAFQHAIELDPHNPLPHASLASLYRKLNRETEYFEHINIARGLITDETVYNRACFEAICGNVEEALVLLQQAIKETPSIRDVARHDEDLAILRDDLRFKALMSK